MLREPGSRCWLISEAASLSAVEGQEILREMDPGCERKGTAMTLTCRAGGVHAGRLHGQLQGHHHARGRALQLKLGVPRDPLDT